MQDINPNLEELELELDNFEEKQTLKLEIDNELDSALKEFENLKEQLPKQQAQSLIAQCTDNAINAVVGHFGLASAVLGAKDGGNVTTTHNFEKGITANEEDKAKFDHYKENQNGIWAEVRKNEGYDKDFNNKRKEAFQNSEKIFDAYTGKELKKDGSTHIDHIVSAKEIDSNTKTHLFLSKEERVNLATNDKNLALTDSSLNQSKGEKDLEKWAKEVDKTTFKSKGEKYKVDDDKIKARNKESRDFIDKKIKNAEFKKYSMELISTGAKDAAKMAIYSAIGVILKDFIQAMMAELKITFKEFGNESLKDIFKRFSKSLKEIWQKLKIKWKNIFKDSLENAIQAFFSNLIVFISNLVFTTLKSIVRIIRAGFTSLYKAIKLIINPPKDMPKEDVLYEASKIFVSGLIMALSMLAAESIKIWLLGIPGLNIILTMPIPFTGESIADALSLSISAACGAVLSTIAIYYMDKFRSENKIGKIRLELVTQSGVIVQLKTAQTWGILHDAYLFAYNEASEAKKLLFNTVNELEQSFNQTNKSVKKLAQNNLKLQQLLKKGE